MRWLPTEYLLKGVFLGLIVYVALQPPDGDSWRKLAQVNLLTLGGLLAALAVGAVAKLREGYRATGRIVLFTLFLLLETPTLVYAGILGGLVAGMVWAYPPD